MSPRNQALTRNPNAFHRLPGSRRSHGFHVFCFECFNRVYLGGAAFKLYLLLAWCIGLAGLMWLQKDNDQKASKHDMSRMLLAGGFLVYLLGQIFGLLATVAEVEKIFAPYVIILAVITILNIATIGFAAIGFFGEMLSIRPVNANPFGISLGLVLLLGSIFLVYNLLCLASVMNLCAKFDKRRLVAERRRRELLTHNARIYERLIALQSHEPGAVIANADSPPKYSSLDMKLITNGIMESPPPGYSQLQRIEDEEDVDLSEEKEKKPFRRALFNDPPV